MKRIASTLLGATMACVLNAHSAPPVPEAGKALIVGAGASRARILFRKLDDAPIIWATPGSADGELTVIPGHHELGVMCEFKSSGKTQWIPGSVPIDVEAGHVYEITGSLERDGRSCNLTVSKRS